MAQRRNLVQIDAAGRYIGRTKRTMRQLVAQRRITYYKVGGRLLFDLDDLDRFLDAHRVDPEPAAWHPSMGGQR